jgi:uncharacterized damage-inducible protein DinB
MNTRISLIAQLADDEFDGECFNGPSFMKTLGKLDASMAAYSDTFEGYSAWDVALHCAYYKYVLAKALGAELGDYPFDKENWGFGASPPTGSPEAWAALLAYLPRAHKAVWDAARAMPEAKLDEAYAEWKVSYAKALSWLASHDTFHGAQIRSMGTPGLKSRK